MHSRRNDPTKPAYVYDSLQLQYDRQWRRPCREENRRVLSECHHHQKWRMLAYMPLACIQEVYLSLHVKAQLSIPGVVL